MEEAGADEAVTEGTAVEDSEAEGLGTEQADGAVGDSGDTVAGIPKMHLVLFGGGMVLAVGSLVLMQVMKKRRETDYGEEYNEDEFGTISIQVEPVPILILNEEVFYPAPSVELIA